MKCEARMSDYYCSNCGKQSVAIVDGDDYYHGAPSICMSCKHMHCCFNYENAHGIEVEVDY